MEGARIYSSTLLSILALMLLDVLPKGKVIAICDSWCRQRSQVVSKSFIYTNKQANISI